MGVCVGGGVVCTLGLAFEAATMADLSGSQLGLRLGNTNALRCCGRMLSRGLQTNGWHRGRHRGQRKRPSPVAPFASFGSSLRNVSVRVRAQTGSETQPCMPLKSHTNILS